MDLDNDDDERMNIQVSYSAVIRDYAAGLAKWLQVDPVASPIEGFEDRELEALLLKVSPPPSRKR